MRTTPAITLAAGAAVAIGGVSVWLFVTRSDTPKQAPQVAQFSSQGVTVSVNVKDRSATRATIVATFSPDKPGFHLYSADLPADGIQGVGRPIKVTPQGSLRSAGKLTANADVVMLHLAGSDLTLPVYPDGPVTAELPVAVNGTGAATLLVSYAACSSENCLPPVTDHPIELRVTSDGIT